MTSEADTRVNYIDPALRAADWQPTNTKKYVLEKSKSLNQPNLSVIDLKNLLIPVPNSQAEREKLVSYYRGLVLKLKQIRLELPRKNELTEQLNNAILDSALRVSSKEGV